MDFTLLVVGYDADAILKGSNRSSLLTFTNCMSYNLWEEMLHMKQLHCNYIRGEKFFVLVWDDCSGLACEGQGADGFGAVAANPCTLKEGFLIQLFANLGAFFTNADTEQGKPLNIL
jgi:hypothetical protein